MSTKTKTNTALPETVSGPELADLIGCSLRSLSDLEDANVIIKPSRGCYKLRESVRNYIDHVSADNDDALKAEKLRKLTADADMAEIMRDKERGRLFDAGRTKKAWEGAVLHARQKLLAIPERCGQQVLTAPSLAAAKDLLKKEITDTLTAFAECRVEVVETETPEAEPESNEEAQTDESETKE